MERIFALYDSDVFYATRFMEYFKKKKEIGFEIAVFTAKESLNEYLHANPVEILLLGDKESAEDINLDHVRYIYHLSDGPQGSGDTKDPRIMKYQAAQNVMSDIMTDYIRREDESRGITGSDNLKIISVLSPVRNLETLLYSWSLAALQSEHQKVLLVLLELLPVRFLQTIEFTDQPLSEFIYYLKENKDITVKMKSLLGIQGNLSYLGGAVSGADILAVNRADIQRWITQLKEHSQYRTIIFYLDGYSEAMTELLVTSDTILVTGVETSYEKAVYQELIRQTENNGVSLKQKKTIQISLPKEDTIEQIPISTQALAGSAVYKLAKQSLELL